VAKACSPPRGMSRGHVALSRRLPMAESRFGRDRGSRIADPDGNEHTFAAQEWALGLVVEWRDRLQTKRWILDQVQELWVRPDPILIHSAGADDLEVLADASEVLETL
jgi:hypothetical protein